MAPTAVAVHTQRPIVLVDALRTSVPAPPQARCGRPIGAWHAPCVNFARVVQALERVSAATQAIGSAGPSRGRGPTPYQADVRTVRNAPDRGGTGRAALLGGLDGVAALRVAHSALIVDGLTDLFRAAGSRTPGGVNGPVLAAGVRALAEAAAETAWLLDPSIDGIARCRRYIRWKLHVHDTDLGHIERAHEDPTTDEDEVAAARSAMAEETARLTADIEAAGRSVSTTGKNGKPASLALLSPTGGRESFPNRGELVAGLLGSPRLYPLISRAAHIEHSGITGSLTRISEARDGRVLVHMTGDGLPDGSQLLVVAKAVNATAGELAAWSGRANGHLLEALRELAALGHASFQARRT